jgi:hypothetical protein
VFLIVNNGIFSLLRLFLPHLHEGQSQEIVKNSKSLHEVLHEGSGKVLVSLVNSTRAE